MTTREQIIAAIKKSDPDIDKETLDFIDAHDLKKLKCFYAIAFEAGRVAERIVTIKDDDDLRFIKRVLEGNNPAEEDKAKCLQLINKIRSHERSTK